MPKSVLIILAAVVVLIAVVVILGMRYLRSDDEEYDEAAATGPGRDRDVPRRRREHEDFDAECDLPRPVARAAAGPDARAAGPRRDARNARRDYQGDDRTELLPAGARASRTQPGRAAGADTPPGRSRTAARDFDRDDRDIRDSDIRHGRRATRTTPAIREVAAAKDEQEDVLPAVKPRQDKGKSKNKRDAVDWPSNEWDELSDVDYWTELAADKPFTADTPESARPARQHRGSGRTGHAREDARPGRTRGEDLTSTGPRPVSSARTERLDPLGPDPRRPDPLGPDPRRPDTRRPDSQRPDTQRVEPARSRHAVSLDDDPLTSPSFPRIDANDSRSYRRSRSGSHERPATGSEYAAAPTSSDQPTGTYARPAAAADGYRPASRDLPVPDSYLTPAWNGASQSGAGAPGAAYDYGTGHNGSGQYSARPDGVSQHGVGQHGASQHGVSQHGAGYYEPAQYGAASAGYGAARYDQLPGYGTGAYDFGAGGHGSDPLGYNGYGSQSASYDSLPPGYAGQQNAGAGYPPASLAEPGYPYQPGGPESYSPSVAPTAPYLYQAPSQQPGHPGSLGDYAGADPYAVDPYGYGNTSY